MYPSVVMRKVRHLTLLLVFVNVCACAFVFWWALFFQHTYFGYNSTELCHTPRLVNETAPCASCVHFVSLAVVDGGRWNRSDDFVRALRVMSTTLRNSQKCFRLCLYTNLPIDGAVVRQLVQAGGKGVELRALPDLPPNRYTNMSRWLELSRAKLDLVEQYAMGTGVDPVWIDMDTLVVSDLSCAVGRARNFVMGRDYPQHSIDGPRGTVLLHPRRSVYGDLWMMDTNLRNAVRALENSGMPPPPYDIQDYLGLLLNRCDGTVTDLRTLVRADGFQQGDEMCFGFDAGQGQHLRTNTTHLTVRDGRLHCMKKEHDGVKVRPVAVLSFVAMYYWDQLKEPEAIFNTTDLRKWAERHGFAFEQKQPAFIFSTTEIRKWAQRHGFSF